MTLTGANKAGAAGSKAGKEATMNSHQKFTARVVDPGLGGCVIVQGQFFFYATEDEENVDRMGNFVMAPDTGSKKMIGKFEWEDEKGIWHPWEWAPYSSVWHSGHSLAHSIWFTRWVVLCSWVYIPTTAAGLALTLLPDCGDNTGALLNWVFHLNYMLTYLSFLLGYMFMAPKPHTTYMLGILQYFIGYTLFFVLYSMRILDIEDELTKDELNVTGSLFFLTGSLCLLPSTRSMAGGLLSPMDRGSHLFWGSCCFLVGAMFFTEDAFNVLFLKGDDVFHEQWKINSMGMTMFLIGRFFFLSGSVTSECGFLFEKKKRQESATCKKNLEGDMPVCVDLLWEV